MLPIWIRAPYRGPEHYSGLTRAKLYEAAGAGLIKTSVLKEPGGSKGVRLFHLQSILDFIAQHEVKPEMAVAGPDEHSRNESASGLNPSGGPTAGPSVGAPMTSELSK